MGVLFVILQTNSCKYISNVNASSRWMLVVETILKLLMMFKFSIRVVSYMKYSRTWRS